jgi:hypothetical protein
MILDSVEIPAPENTTIRRAPPSRKAAWSSPTTVTPPSIPLGVAVLLEAGCLADRLGLLVRHARNPDSR